MSNYNSFQDVLPTFFYTGVSLLPILIFYLVFFAVFLVIMTVVCVYCIICNWKLFEKAGEPGWKALVPFYNVYTLNQIAFTKPTSTVFFIVFCASLILVCIPYLGALLYSMIIGVYAGFSGYAVTKSFGRDSGMCVLGIFFSPVVFAILAFSKDIKYTGDRLTVFSGSN